jgi:hypothetical protein
MFCQSWLGWHALISRPAAPSVALPLRPLETRDPLTRQLATQEEAAALVLAGPGESGEFVVRLPLLRDRLLAVAAVPGAHRWLRQGARCRPSLSPSADAWFTKASGADGVREVPAGCVHGVPRLRRARPNQPGRHVYPSNLPLRPSAAPGRYTVTLALEARGQGFPGRYADFQETPLRVEVKEVGAPNLVLTPEGLRKGVTRGDDADPPKSPLGVRSNRVETPGREVVAVGKTVPGAYDSSLTRKSANPSTRAAARAAALAGPVRRWFSSRKHGWGSERVVLRSHLAPL